MFANFEKAFFPIEEDKLKRQELINNLEQENTDFWLGKGLSVVEIKKIIEMENEEQENLHIYQEWVSRRNLVESGILNVEQIKDELSKETISKGD